MAPCFASLKTTARTSGLTVNRKPAAAVTVRPAAAFSYGPAVPRNVLRRATPSDEEEKGVEMSKNDFEVPHTGRSAPMSEVKRSAAEQQGAAPDGDRAIAGQAWQPTGAAAEKETPADRYGSNEAAEEAMEAAKDRSRKSELQTGDDTSKTTGGGNAGEGCSA